MKLQITWVDLDGNALCIGLDEVVEIETEDVAAAKLLVTLDAQNYALEGGYVTQEQIDAGYHPEIEIVEDDDAA